SREAIQDAREAVLGPDPDALRREIGQELLLDRKRRRRPAALDRVARESAGRRKPLRERGSLQGDEDALADGNLGTRTAGDAAHDRDPLRTQLLGGGTGPLGECPDDRALVRGREVGPARLELRRGQIAYLVEQGRLYPREREVEARHPGDRKRKGLRVALP